MIKFTNTSVMNFGNAIRGARNPMNSWAKSDSAWCFDKDGCEEHKNCHMQYCIGPNDMDLLKRLRKAGSDHRKFMRQIFVSVDICAPLYWWKEMDQYRVAVVSNSCSTMHKIHSKPIKLSDFSMDDFYVEGEDINLRDCFINAVADCEMLRKKFIETKDKKYWRGLIQLLPESYNQLRTVTMNYETLVNMYHARKNHKLTEWHELCAWIETLPYAKELIIAEEN
jgi:hypothetical protein